MRTSATMTYVVFGACLVLIALGLGLQEPRPASVSSQQQTVPARSHAPLPPEASAAGSGAPLPEATPGGAVTLSAQLARPAVLSGTSEAQHVRLLVEAKQIVRERPPVNLAVVIDRSGSMQGKKLADAKAAVSLLVDRLDERDRLALVIYDDVAEELYPSSPLSESHRSAMKLAMNGVTPRGSTNISDGLAEGVRAVKAADREQAISRVLLVSDGLANEGIVDGRQLAEVASRYRGMGVTVSTIGVGLDFDHHLMSAVAEGGAGLYHYLKDSEALPEGLATELGQTTATVARDVGLLLRLAPGVRVGEVYGFAHERPDARTVWIPLPDLSSGAGWQVLCRLETPPAEGAAMPLLDARLLYRDLAGRGGRQVAGMPPLGAEVTRSPERVAQVANSAVEVEVVRMEGALAAQRAAALLEERRNQEAAAVLAEAQRRTEEANKRLKSSSLFSFGGNLRTLFAASASTLGGDEQKELVKYQHGMARDFGSTSGSAGYRSSATPLLKRYEQPTPP